LCLFCQKGIDIKVKNVIGFADLCFLRGKGIERLRGHAESLRDLAKIFVNIGKGREKAMRLML